MLSTAGWENGSNPSGRLVQSTIFGGLSQSFKLVPFSWSTLLNSSKKAVCCMNAREGGVG